MTSTIQTDHEDWPLIEEEETTELSLADIYNRLLINKELILTVPKDQEETLRKGLASVKSKQNTKLKESGIQPDSSQLQYNVTPSIDIPDAVDVHIILSKRTSITVLKMQRPDDF